MTDGRHYRALGLPVIDTTSRTPSHVAAGIAEFVHRGRASRLNDNASPRVY